MTMTSLPANDWMLHCHLHNQAVDHTKPISVTDIQGTTPLLVTPTEAEILLQRLKHQLLDDENLIQIQHDDLAAFMSTDGPCSIGIAKTTEEYAQDGGVKTLINHAGKPYQQLTHAYLHLTANEDLSLESYEQVCNEVQNQTQPATSIKVGLKFNDDTHKALLIGMMLRGV